MRTSSRPVIALLALLAAGQAASGQAPPGNANAEPVFVASPKTAALDVRGEAARVIPVTASSPVVTIPTEAAADPAKTPPAPLKMPAPMDPTPIVPEPITAPKESAGKETKEGGKDGSDSNLMRHHLYDSLHDHDHYGLKSLFDSLHQPGEKGKWYEKLSLRGYTQFRFGRAIYQDTTKADPNLLGDRSITGNTDNFSIRRARLILSGDISDHLSIYFQPDFASSPQGATTTSYFTQIRDWYADVYVDTTRIHRFRVGFSKVPFGFENMQSSSNRIALDRTDAINSAVSPNERDLGVFYYWTPVEKQQILRDLVDGGLKGSGNYGIFGIGVYDGQGGGQFEQNLNLHTVARVTYPFQLPGGQVVEGSIQAYTGQYVVQGSPIRPLGQGSAITPANTGGTRGLRDERVGGTVVWYPQPFGFQAEWNWGQGPGLSDDQTEVDTRNVRGGYLMAMYKCDTESVGIFTPYARYQFFKGGYRSQPNAPYGKHQQWDLGVEWQIRKEMELVVEYSIVDGVNLTAVNRSGVTSYRNFDGGVLRAQFQVNY